MAQIFPEHFFYNVTKTILQHLFVIKTIRKARE